MARERAPVRCKHVVHVAVAGGFTAATGPVDRVMPLQGKVHVQVYMAKGKVGSERVVAVGW